MHFERSTLNRESLSVYEMIETSYRKISSLYYNIYLRKVNIYKS